MRQVKPQERSPIPGARMQMELELKYVKIFISVSFLGVWFVLFLEDDRDFSEFALSILVL